MFTKIRLYLLTAAIVSLIFIFIPQVRAAHCYEGFRDCIKECSAAAPGSGGAAPLECLQSCNAGNEAISARAEECLKQEQGEEQGKEEGEQIKDPLNVLPSYSIPKKTRQSSENVSPTPQVLIRRLDGGSDIKPGETVTAKEGEILLIDFRDGSFVEVNSGASFAYQDKKDETIFEILKGSMRFIFEPATKLRKVTSCCLVTSVRGTDFVVNEEEDKTEVLVFDGKLAVSDISGNNTVEVDGGYKTQVKKGGGPTKPVLFDPSKIDRWFDAITGKNPRKQPTPQQWAIFAVFMIVMLTFIYFGIKWNIKLLKRLRR